MSKFNKKAIQANYRIIALAFYSKLGDPSVSGKNLADIIRFLMRRIPETKRGKAIGNMITKLRLLDSKDISIKKMMPYSSMGQSISLIKNVLAGYDSTYIRSVLDAIIRNLVY